MTDLAEACRDLAAWLPALAAALSRDNSPPDSRSVLSAGGVVNIDVLQAMITLTREIPATRQAACDLTGEPCPPRPLTTCLRALPRLHGRLTDLGQHFAAAQIDEDADRWTRMVKLALGLRTRDTPIGWDCPLHEEPCPLILIGSDGFIRDDMTMFWQYSERIWCRLCGASWDSLQWGHLGRLLETA